MHSLKKSFIISAIFMICGVFAGTATASGPKGVMLSAPNKVSVNYTSCTSGGTPYPCVSFLYSLANSSKYNAICQVSVPELNGFISFDATVPAGATLMGNITTPYNPLTTTFLHLVPSCTGATVLGGNEKVKTVYIVP